MVRVCGIEVNAQRFSNGLMVCELFPVVRGDGVQQTLERHQFPYCRIGQWHGHAENREKLKKEGCRNATALRFYIAATPFFTGKL